MENSNFGKQIDPFAFEQEKQKWVKRGEFGIVLILRGVFYILKLLLKVALEVFKNVLKTFKILPS